MQTERSRLLPDDVLGVSNAPLGTRPARNNTQTENSIYLSCKAVYFNNISSKQMANFTEGLGIFRSFFDGMTKVYATGGLIADITMPGLWLLAPVSAGGFINLSAQIFASVKTRCPDGVIFNGTSKMAKNASEFLFNYLHINKVCNDAVLGYFEDLGFTWSMVNTIAIQFDGVAYNRSIFARAVAPAISAVSAGFVRHARYLHANGRQDKAALEIIANTFWAASSSTFIMDLLKEQEILTKDSIIPVLLIAVTAMAGFFSGIFKTVKNPHPKISLFINSVIELLFENPSLAAAFFAFPNDIYAVLNDDELSEWFFFSNVGISGVYLLMLTIASVVQIVKEYKELNKEAHDPAHSSKVALHEEQKNKRDYLVINSDKTGVSGRDLEEGKGAFPASSISHKDLNSQESLDKVRTGEI